MVEFDLGLEGSSAFEQVEQNVQLLREFFTLHPLTGLLNALVFLKLLHRALFIGEIQNVCVCVCVCVC